MGKKDYEAIYPLSPAQQGMLFESLRAPGSGIHIEQVSCILSGSLKPSAFERTWQMLIERHPILRTVFVWKDQVEPLQVVLRNVEAPIERNDWRGCSSAEQQRRLQEYLAAERMRGFEVTKPPLIRLALFDLDNGHYQFVWTYHHILMDGWCRPILFRELLSLYDACNEGLLLQLQETRPYHDYIVWLRQQDLGKAEAFWKRTLKGFTKPTPLGRNGARAAAISGEPYSEIAGRLPAELFSNLQNLARQNQVTINTVVQGAWSILLGRYSGLADVIFGATVAGRPPGETGFESTIGLFINTLPVRVEVPPEAFLWPWLRDVQARNFELRRFEYTSAGQVHQWCDVPGSLPLYESLLVFENYPTGASLEASDLTVDIQHLRSKGAQTKHPITILATEFADLVLQIITDNGRLGDGDGAAVLRHLLKVLSEMAVSPDGQLSQLFDLIPLDEIPHITKAGGTQGPGVAGDFAAPRTPIEETISELWAQSLGRARIGVHDDFFELGGHSLLATQLIVLLRKSFQVNLPLRILFEAPTIAKLAVEIARIKGKQTDFEYSLDHLPDIVPDIEHRYDPFPLTDVQQAYWVGRSAALELGNVATHNYWELESEVIDVSRFERAWQKLIDRHEMLRAIVLPDGRQQILRQPPDYHIRVLDLRTATPEEIETGLQSVRDQMSHQVLRTDQWPLFEIRASLLPAGTVRLHISFDLLIGDAWSFQIMAADITRFYVNPDAELEQIEVSFRDYIFADQKIRESEQYRRSQQYWWQRLDEFPLAPELPLAMSPNLLEKPIFVRRVHTSSRSDWKVLKGRATRRGLTPSGLLLAVYAEILALWSKSQRFTINLTLFNRLPMHRQIDDVVGDFTSLTLLEVDNLKPESFKQRARRLQQQLWEDLDHRYVSAVSVLRELARLRGPAAAVMPVVFTSVLNLTTGQEGAEGAEDAPTPAQDDSIRTVYSIGQTPQVWLDLQVYEQAGALVCEWDSVEELFPEGLVQDMFGAFQGMIERLAEDEDAWSELAQDLMPVEQVKER
ncbi:MAG TPA: condensation domain-containing protein, partial [Blastocatellia bacterium]|nr:condensation domain-containing protein [Blastocatellia bacterium]